MTEELRMGLFGAVSVKMTLALHRGQCEKVVESRWDHYSHSKLGRSFCEGE